MVVNLTTTELVGLLLKGLLISTLVITTAIPGVVVLILGRVLFVAIVVVVVVILRPVVILVLLVLSRRVEILRLKVLMCQLPGPLLLLWNVLLLLLLYIHLLRLLC